VAVNFRVRRGRAVQGFASRPVPTFLLQSSHAALLRITVYLISHDASEKGTAGCRSPFFSSDLPILLPILLASDTVILEIGLTHQTHVNCLLAPPPRT
jgi:hypothetical protein